jgi:Putative zinc-finger
MSFSCTDKDTLVDYLYGECDDATRGEVNAHLAVCPACADEVSGFARVRETLSRWSPPERVGNFRLVRDEPSETAAPATVLRPARWWQTSLPAMARVAAAILLFAGGAALANLDVRYDKDGFSVRTGWQPRAASARAADAVAPPAADRGVVPVPTLASATTTPASGAADAPWRVDMAALERSLREEFHQQLAAARLTGSGAVPVSASADTSAGEARLMNQVHALIDESYHRQQAWMAYSISKVERDMQAQRQVDYVRAQQTFGQFDGPPVYAPEQRQMMNYIRLNPVSLKK